METEKRNLCHVGTLKQEDQYFNGCKIEVGILRQFNGYDVYIDMESKFNNFLKFCNFKGISISYNGKVFDNYLKVRADQHVTDLQLNGQDFCKVYKIVKSKPL